MSDYSAIDPILTQWAEKRDLHVYTGHLQNVVRSVTVYNWMGAHHESTGHIWVDAPNELGLVGLHGAHRGFRFDEAVPVDQLEKALESACERLAAQNELAEPL